MFGCFVIPCWGNACLPCDGKGCPLSLNKVCFGFLCVFDCTTSEVIGVMNCLYVLCIYLLWLHTEQWCLLLYLLPLSSFHSFFYYLFFYICLIRVYMSQLLTLSTMEADLSRVIITSLNLLFRKNTNKFFMDRSFCFLQWSGIDCIL